MASIIMIKLFHLFISAMCAAVFLDSVNLTEPFHVSLKWFVLTWHLHTTKGPVIKNILRLLKHEESHMRTSKQPPPPPKKNKNTKKNTATIMKRVTLECAGHAGGVAWITALLVFCETKRCRFKNIYMKSGWKGRAEKKETWEDPRRIRKVKKLREKKQFCILVRQLSHLCTSLVLQLKHLLWRRRILECHE